MSFFAFVHDLIFPPRDTERTLRATDALTPQPHTIPSHPFPTTALTRYDTEQVRAAILETKFHRSSKGAQLLGTLLADYIQERFYPLSTVLVVPMPLAKEREHERGHNQVHTICAEAVKLLPDLVIIDALTRTKHTAPQTTLKKEERRENVVDAFIASPLDPSYTYLLLDDVTTTGATVYEAVRALQRAGATTIVPLALAH